MRRHTEIADVLVCLSDGLDAVFSPNKGVEKDPEDTIYWDGELCNASFAVTVPPEIRDTSVPGEISVYINKLKIMRLNFILDIVQQTIAEKNIILTREIRKSVCLICQRRPG